MEKNRNGNNSGYKGRQSYVGAPYNFVSLPQKVYDYQEENHRQTWHNEMSDELFTGEVEYRITANTPIIVGDGKKDASGLEHFVKDSEGRYAIPGSTVRGLIRSNVQILGLSSVCDDIDDYTLMYRYVAKGARKAYNAILGSNTLLALSDNVTVNVVKNVKAGYLVKEEVNGKEHYYIYQTKVDFINKEELGEMNYYVLSEKTILNDNKNGKKSYPFFQNRECNILQHNLNYIDGKMLNDKEMINRAYSPYSKLVAYKIKNEKEVVAVDNPETANQRNDYAKGCAVSSGTMKNKNVLYIVPEIDRSKEKIIVPDSDVEAYKRDYTKKENKLGKKEKDYFKLPKEGAEPKPVFYIQNGGNLFFGFTPRLRLSYENSVKKGLKGKQGESILDYGKVMFGYSSNTESYRSKLSFSDAVLTGKKKEIPEQKKVLAEPKPTSYMDYLKQDGKTVDYNGNFELRGIKQYWLRDTVAKTLDDPKNDNIFSKFIPLDKGSIFTGKVRFQNLTKDELGLLLWSIRLNENSRMNIGKAKAFGYGNVTVEIIGAKKIDFERAYCFDEGLNLSPYEDINVDIMIQAYKDHINTFLKGGDIDKLPSIEEFFLMKAADRMPQEGSIRYMNVRKEYQYRSKALPSPKEVIEESEKANKRI